ncbi:epidermal retinol dehydrogenase 2-like [Venturia canescens]|uniref:epidermal retinol dehydrogenase 2-like n=1 Tax=Venturia canescens TaxID=32260 RepID=UPI001C9CB364|nr:epidermal retinol dehydrogenase 2-like [Venturia canescens]XP_043285439.1 epidermal retinol dehydrogenase 2-like [Venturia canescens]XP_043285440.1 epidermal retinol dehydrogenase 2-like [Venturia canescens]
MVKAYEGAVIVLDVLLLLVRIVFWTLEGIFRMIVPCEERNVAGEIVLVTGAGHGIGREIALKYASLGATIVCWDLNPQGNQETINEIKKLGASSVHGYQCDVSSREQVLKTAERVKADVGNVTILVNNAGIMPCRPLLEHTTEEIRKIFDINVLAHYWMLQAFLPSMIAKNHGHVVAMSSIAGLIGLPNIVPYCASKFAVRGLMESLGEELRARKDGQPNNVKLTTIYPYMVDTGLCKKPKIRFPSIMALVTPQEAAEKIVSSQRRSYPEVSIPACWLHLNTIMKNLPHKVSLQLIDFLDSGVESVD